MFNLVAHDRLFPGEKTNLSEYETLEAAEIALQKLLGTYTKSEPLWDFEIEETGRP